MTTTLGKTKDTDISGDFRQFIINCLGENDQRKYFSISSFGSDFNVPVDSRGLTIDSKNKDDKFVIGFLNLLKIDDLEPGENAIFSTSEDGTEIKSKIILRNTGDIEIESTGISLTIDGDANITATGDINLTSDGNVVVDSTQLDVNSGNLTVD